MGHHLVVLINFWIYLYNASPWSSKYHNRHLFYHTRDRCNGYGLESFI